MKTVSGEEMINIFMNAQLISEFYQATSAITTHAAFAAIGVIIFHFKIMAFFFIKQHQAVGPHTKTSITNVTNMRCGQRTMIFCPVVHYNKIVACALVFFKTNFHN